MRSATIALPFLLLAPFVDDCGAQVLSGHIAGPELAGHRLVLLATRGGEHYPIDSVAIGPQGDFRFTDRDRPGAGFYQLALHDSDRVDIILDPREPAVELGFSGLPLQRTVAIGTSVENQLLWRYKLASRQAQAVQQTVAREKNALDPMDVRSIMALDSTEAVAMQEKDRTLHALTSEAPRSYFARVVKASAAIDREVVNGPHAISGVFDFADASLLRSSVYDKAVMAFIQSINAISEEQLTNASDTLLQLAWSSMECRDYMIEHLVDLFSVYGPQSTLQHLVDAYLAGDRPVMPMAPRLRAKVEGLLAVSLGAQGADIPLTDTLGRVDPLSVVSKGQRFSLLFFYSSTCDHCHAQMPGVNALLAQYRGRGFGVVGIALDDDRDSFRSNILGRGLAFPCFSEFNGWGSSAAKAYEVKATPTMILLDAQRRIVAKPYDPEALAMELAGRLPGEGSELRKQEQGIPER